MNSMSQIRIADIVQIPLAISSYVLQKIVKQAMRGLVALGNRSAKTGSSGWRVLSGDLVNRPFSLAIFMTKAPRWNTHAVIGMAGPMELGHSLSIQTDCSPDASWAMVLHSENGSSKQSVSSTEESTASGWQNIETRPGRYTLVIRYYSWGDRLCFPAIKVDGQQVVEEQEVDKEANLFYHGLSNRRNAFYVALNYYVHTMLRFSGLLPERFIKSEYVPAGDSGMLFDFGASLKGSALQVSLKPELLSDFDAYLTLYDRASFPVYWTKLTEPVHTTARISENGHYLIRLRSRDESKNKPDHLPVLVTTVPVKE